MKTKIGIHKSIYLVCFVLFFLFVSCEKDSIKKDEVVEISNDKRDLEQIKASGTLSIQDT